MSIRGANATGLSDPFVVVELLGQTQQTEWFEEKSSQFFDQTFYFNFKDLKKEQVQEAHLKISLYDHNNFRSHELLGIYNVCDNRVIDFKCYYGDCVFYVTFTSIFVG